MTLCHRHSLKPLVAMLVVATLITAPGFASADEQANMEQLRTTTLSLIDALVENGVLAREKADKLIADAEAKAKARVGAAPAPEVGKDGKKIVRVPYVPESVKREIREQVKTEVLAQAKTERWGEPGALPDWLDRFSFEGDMRLRYEATRLPQDNSPPGSLAYWNGPPGAFSRAADIATNTGTNGWPNFNTQENFDRWRVRARLGVNAKLSDTASAGVRVSTGNLTNRVSTNQTMGQNFNRYSVVLDRAYIKLNPYSWLTFSGGRIDNPFFGTDLLWADDLGFEGLALTATPRVSDSLRLFATAGWFPLQANSPLRTNSRDLVGVQGGVDWKLDSSAKLKLSTSLYKYRGVEGQRENDDAYSFGLGALVPNYGVRYEYPDGFRQRGNTLFAVNNLNDAGAAIWGLAAEFRELNLTLSLDLSYFDPVHVVVTGDYVKNLAFDRRKMEQRSSVVIEDGKDYGYLARIVVGQPTIAKRGDWNVSLAYRYLGSDAVLDAFTNSDFGLGGTNNKGYILGLSYGIDKNTWLSARWLSSDVIDPMTPRYTGFAPRTKLSVDIFQLDLNARF